MANNEGLCECGHPIHSKVCFENDYLDGFRCRCNGHCDLCGANLQNGEHAKRQCPNYRPAEPADALEDAAREWMQANPIWYCGSQLYPESYAKYFANFVRLVTENAEYDAKAIWKAATAHAKAAVDEFRVTVRKAIISEQYTSSEMDEQTESSAFLMHRYNKGLQRAARVVDEVAAEILGEKANRRISKEKAK